MRNLASDATVPELRTSSARRTVSRLAGAVSGKEVAPHFWLLILVWLRGNRQSGQHAKADAPSVDRHLEDSGEGEWRI